MPELIVRKWDGPYSFMIFREEGLYKARRGDNGSIQFEDPELHEVLNDVWNALTPGRTWKEKVVLKGNFTINDTIKIPSYTILDLRDAEIKLADAANVNMLENEGLDAGNTDIEIVGGVLNGNRLKQNDGHGIYLKNVSNSKIEGCTVKDIYKTGIYFDICENNRIIKNLVTNTGDFGIVYYDSKDAIIEQNIADATENTGIYLNRLSGKGYSIVSGNIVKGVTGVDAGIFADVVEKVIISNNLVYNSLRGIFIFECLNFIVTSNVSYNNTLQGIFVDANSSFGVIAGNQCISNGSEGIRIDDDTCTDIIIINNMLQDNNPNLKNWSPYNIIIKHNIGYVTENSGIATGTGAQQSIAHGCDFTPTKAQVIVSNIDDGANPYLSADPDATNIYVTAVSGKDYRWEVKRSP